MSLSPLLLPRYASLAAPARLVALLAIGLPMVALRDTTGLISMLFLAGIWVSATTLDVLARLPAYPAVVLEGTAVAVVCALSLLDRNILVMTALAVTPFIAGLRRGVRGTLLVLAVQVVMLAATAFQLHQPLDQDLGSAVFTGTVLGLGLGLLAAFLRSVQSRPDRMTPYRDARALLQQLLGLSWDLSAGLDPVSIAQRIMDSATGMRLVSSATVLVRDDRHGFLPLLDTPNPAPPEDQELLHRAWHATAAVQEGTRFALPLATDAGTVGILSGELVAGVEVGEARERLQDLADDLAGDALRLDTALLFSAVREQATSEERQRLAREVHDGIAQEVASLGYVVDALAADPVDPPRAEQLRLLREAITRVVSDIRRTVSDLRQEGAASQGVGQRITAVAERLSDASAMPIDVHVVEGDHRLRPEVEGELVRIVQEALNNAVRHSGGSRVVVDLDVDAPRADITVRDDGRGLGGSRPDSHGLRIMTERGRRIGAEVGIESDPGRGVTVTVRMSPRSSARADQPVREQAAREQRVRKGTHERR